MWSGSNLSANKLILPISLSLPFVSSRSACLCFSSIFCLFLLKRGDEFSPSNSLSSNFLTGIVIFLYLTSLVSSYNLGREVYLGRIVWTIIYGKLMPLLMRSSNKLAFYLSSSLFSLISCLVYI